MSEKNEKKKYRTRYVRNRDIPKLAEVLAVMQSVNMAEQNAMWQQDRMFGTSQRITGMPGGKGVPKGLDAAFAALELAQKRQHREINGYLAKLRAAEKIINGIESATMRAFVEMMYVHCLPPDEVRKELNMTQWEFRSARKSIEDAEDMRSVEWHERFSAAKNANPS